MLKAQTFPNATEKERITTLKKFQRLYDGEHFPVLGLHNIIKSQYENEKDIVYLAHNLPAYISDFYGDFVAGDVDQMIIRGNTGNAEVDKFIDEVVFENDLKEKISDIGAEQSEFGFVPLLGWLDTSGVYHISPVAQDQYFPQGDGSVVFATYREVYTGLEKITYCLTQHYQLIGNDCVIERQAWEADQTGTLQKPADFAFLTNLIGRPFLTEREVIKDLADLPIRQVDNTRVTRYGFGKSDYWDIVPQLAETNERATHIATQLLKNLDAKMQLPASMFDEEGNVEKFEAISIESKEEPEAKYVINANPLIADAREHITQQIKTISLITAVPMWELLKTAMPERVESMRIQMFATMRRTSRKRARIQRAINDMFRIGFKMKGIKHEEDIEISFSDVLPVDELTQATVEETKTRSGLSSRRSAIMRLENMDIDEAEEEMKQIASEEKIAGIGDNPPVLDATV